MADEPGATGDASPAPASGEAGACMPCRGTGKVISNLGGKRCELPCPWCRGTGRRTPGVDAQERFSDHADAAEGR
jgi:DnaJ-class molecular chaperone